MPNPDPTTFQPPPPLIKEEDFTDELQPGAMWHFRFIAYPDFTLQKPMNDKLQEYTERYLSPADGSLPAKLPPLGDGANRREVSLDENIIQAAALLETMQQPEEEADRWNFIQWAYFYLVAPSAFEAAATFAGSMIEEAKTGKGNSLSPATASVSGHSSTITNGIQPLSTIYLPTCETELQSSEVLQDA